MDKSTKYATLIAQSEEEQVNQNRDLQVETAELELKGHLLTIKKAKVTAEQNLIKTKSAIPYSARAIYVASVEVDKLDREIKFLEKLQKEQF